MPFLWTDAFRRIPRDTETRPGVEYAFLGIQPTKSHTRMLDGTLGARVNETFSAAPSYGAQVGKNDLITHWERWGGRLSNNADCICGSLSLRWPVTGWGCSGGRVSCTLRTRRHALHFHGIAVGKNAWHCKRQKIVTSFPPDWRAALGFVSTSFDRQNTVK